MSGECAGGPAELAQILGRHDLRTNAAQPVHEHRELFADRRRCRGLSMGVGEHRVGARGRRALGQRLQ